MSSTYFVGRADAATGDGEIMKLDPATGTLTPTGPTGMTGGGGTNWCPVHINGWDENNVWALWYNSGAGGYTYVTKWNGTSWSAPYEIADKGARGIGVVSANEVYVKSQVSMAKWNGSAWSIIFTETHFNESSLCKCDGRNLYMVHDDPYPGAVSFLPAHPRPIVQYDSGSGTWAKDANPVLTNVPRNVWVVPSTGRVFLEEHFSAWRRQVHTSSGFNAGAYSTVLDHNTGDYIEPDTAGQRVIHGSMNGLHGPIVLVRNRGTGGVDHKTWIYRWDGATFNLDFSNLTVGYWVSDVHVADDGTAIVTCGTTAAGLDNGFLYYDGSSWSHIYTVGRPSWFSSWAIPDRHITSPIGGLYVDTLQTTDVWADGSTPSQPTPINCIPEHDEINVSVDASIRLIVASLIAEALDANVKVYVTIGSSAEVQVYDQTAVGSHFLASWTGTELVRASYNSGINDELVLSLTPPTAFPGETLIGVRVTSNSGTGAHSSVVSYSFTTEDIDGPDLVSLSWVEPRVAILEFEDACYMDNEVGAANFIRSIGPVEVLDPTVAVNTVQLSTTTPDAGWIGSYLHLHNAGHIRNNGAFLINNVDTTNKRVTVTAAKQMVADNGKDVDAQGVVRCERTVLAYVTNYRFVPQMSREVVADDVETSTQCAYAPAIINVRQLHEDELPPLKDIRKLIRIELQSGISFGRHYDIECNNVESVLFVTRTTPTTLAFVSPTFGLPANRMTLWGLLDENARTLDLAYEAQLRKMCVVLQDMMDQWSWWVRSLKDFWDPATCPESMLDDALYTLGIPFRYPIQTEMAKRRLLAGLLAIYKQCGHEVGMETILRICLAKRFDVIPVMNPNIGWILGDAPTPLSDSRSILGGTGTVVPPGVLLPGTTYLYASSSFERNWYDVEFLDHATATLEDWERQAIRDIVEFAEPANLHYHRLIES